MPGFHLAQINIGRMLGSSDSPVMAGFFSQLDAVNRVADESPGFVWRLKDEAGNATAIRAFDDPMLIVNVSVWESIDALKEFVYRSAHMGVLRSRAEWFEKPTQAHMAVWWVPAGHIPSLEECKERLEHRRAHGDTPFAFSFARAFPMPEIEKVAEAS
jgi:hypothetical protein